VLLEVKLINWRPFELVDPPVEFTPGINFLYGDNGAGKSSFLDAVMYGLYGNLPYNLADAVRRGKNYARVEIRIKGLDGNVYQLQRTLRIRQTKGGERRGYTEGNATKIYFPDGTVITGSEEVTKHVIDILGVSDRLFSETLYLRQGELREIVLKTGQRRAEYLDKLIGTIDLENCYKTCAELVSWAEGNRSTFETLGKNLEEDVKKLPGLEAEAETNRGKIDALGQRADALKKDKERSEKEKETLEKIENEIEEKKNSLKVENTRLEKFQSELKSNTELLREIEEAEKEIEKISGEILVMDDLEKERGLINAEIEELLKEFVSPKNLTTQIDALEKEIEKRNKRISRLKSRKEELGDILEKVKGLKDVEAQYDSQNRLYLETRDTLTEINTELKHLQTTFRNVVEYKGGSCPTCLQEIKSDYAETLTKKLEEDISKRKKDLTTRKEILQGLKRKVEELQAQRDDLKSLASQIGNLQSDVQELDEQIKELEELHRNLDHFVEQLRNAEIEAEKIEKKKTSVKELDEKLSYLLRRQGQLKELDKKVAAKRTVQTRMEQIAPQEEKCKIKCNELAGELENLRCKFDKNRLKQLETHLEELEKEIKEVDNEKSRLGGELKRIEVQITELKDKKEKLMETTKSLNRWRNILALIGVIRQAFRGSQPILRQQFLDSVNVEAQQIFMDIKRKKRLESLEITSDYEMNVVEAGRSYSIEQYSGGEKTLISLVFRTALAKALAGDIPLLIYDEPTEYLDRGHRENLVNWLSEWGEIRQIIVVSQLDDFNAVADNVKEVQMREDGTSIVI